MFFMGTCAAGYYNSTNQMKVEDDNIKKITVTRGEFDRLNVTRDGSDAAFADADGWNYNTAFIAEFNGTLDAGNISYQLEQIDAIRIKHRRKGDLKWNTLYEKPIADYADLEFDYFDRIAGNKTEYEYCAVPQRKTGGDLTWKSKTTKKKYPLPIMRKNSKSLPPMRC